eukprot:CAMPEP_0196595432 /NCGR_PEP_ID=MMETSP1081-20130531/81089_1 /TAXON_ID=36882 /ORGANISM="Pyramimonas amylifera, Strain CCMP720" /LENGTH=376 /DNA_ID=CAMNT_0041920001 /DNA_START=221 /DNA_END=1351 /DNA_ORIENTATION=-
MDGGSVHVFHTSDKDVGLSYFGEYRYDMLILMGSDFDYMNENFEVSSIMDFVDDGHDLIIATDASASETVREIASECGVDLDEAGSQVLDHLSSVVTKQADETLITSHISKSSSDILGVSVKKAPILFRGTAQIVDVYNDLLVRFLDAPDSAYSSDPKVEVPSLAPLVGGRTLSLVTALQARNNARVVVCGSLEMMGNLFFHAPQPNSNRELSQGLLQWAMHMRGELRLSSVQHRLKDSTLDAVASSQYTVGNVIQVSMEIMQFSKGKWVPYLGNDVQVEFTMLNPMIRKTLSHDDKGNFFTEFAVPDVYGVFKLVVNYDKPGFSRLLFSQKIPVRPFKHNEKERFIIAAYPFYSSSFSMMIGACIFGIVFLYRKD